MSSNKNFENKSVEQVKYAENSTGIATNSSTIEIPESMLIEQDEYVKSKNKKSLIIICVCVFILILSAVLYVVFKQQHSKKVDEALNVETFYEGIVVNGKDLSGKTLEEAKEILKSVEDALIYPVDITITSGTYAKFLSEEDFDYSFNTDDVLEEAYNYARSGDKDVRYKLLTELKETPKEFTISKTPLYRTIPGIVEEVEQALYVAAVEPYVSEFNPFNENMFVYTDGTNGAEVDTQQLQDSITKALDSQEVTTITPVLNEILFTGSIDDLPSQTQLISSYTTVSTNNSNGNKNMQLSLGATNGTILQPEDVFSFNQTTGDTTNGILGYLQAGAIINGKLSSAYGGGICQSSSTIYGAVLRADLEIVTRSPHSWPSTYVPIGQDAAVDYPYTDFQFKNNTSTPIFIKAYMTGTTLHVEIYGKPSDEWDSIQITSAVTETIPAGEATYTDDPASPVGTETVEREARTGYRAVATKIYYKDGVEIKREAAPSSYYRPISAIIKRGTMVVEETPTTE